MSNLGVIQEIYAAFDAKNLERVIDLCDPACVITQDEALPWGGRYEGPGGIATFAITLASTIQSTVTPIEIYAAGDRVVQYGRTAGNVIATQVPFDVAETHVWTLSDGKVVAAEFYIDSAAMLSALRQPG
ncbi:MAG: hypothetical protein JWL73_2994 [Actinomycetia bacterium]|nr:hypothetical protein [Actinomycetes bacterium]